MLCRHNLLAIQLLFMKYFSFGVSLKIAKWHMKLWYAEWCKSQWILYTSAKCDLLHNCIFVELNDVTDTKFCQDYAKKGRYIKWIFNNCVALCRYPQLDIIWTNLLFSEWLTCRINCKYLSHQTSASCWRNNTESAITRYSHHLGKFPNIWELNKMPVTSLFCIEIASYG